MFKLYLIVFMVILSSTATGYFLIKKEHKEARELKIELIDFNDLKDGKFIGKYEGGIYGWRENEIEIIIENGKLASLKFINSVEKGRDNPAARELFERIISKQTLDVDAISGATLTTNGILKTVEIALKSSIK